MPAKCYRVRLIPKDRQHLKRLVNTGTGKARTLTRARILLLADEGPGGPAKTDRQIVDGLGVCLRMVAATRERFVQGGFQAALYEQSRPGQPRKLSGKARAHLTALACSHPPEGHARWTLRLLADKAVELGLAQSLSHETVRRVLKKTTSNRI